VAQRLPLPIHTLYAELVERCALDQLVSEFPVGGNFFTKTNRGRTYWYFREAAGENGKRRDRYVGPDTPELQRRIQEHREAKASYRERRTLVTALQRAGLRPPKTKIGQVLQALANAGVFRLRAVVVGKAAYQAYAGLLGVLLANRNVMTSDIDLAQFESISIAVGDAIETPFVEILKSIDPRFEPVMDPVSTRHATRYAAGDALRVDILTPDEGRDDGSPVMLPALQAEAQPLPFLDFLIYEEVQAVVLFGAGIAINVPAPERFALHKLLVSRLRVQNRESQAKAAKDLRQASELIDVLCELRPYELRDLWSEMTGRGPKWNRMAHEALALLDTAAGSSTVREKFRKVVSIP
jgi:hypothetical protein